MKENESPTKDGMLNLHRFRGTHWIACKKDLIPMVVRHLNC